MRLRCERPGIWSNVLIEIREDQSTSTPIATLNSDPEENDSTWLELLPVNNGKRSYLTQVTQNQQYTEELANITVSGISSKARLNTLYVFQMKLRGNSYSMEHSHQGLVVDRTRFTRKVKVSLESASGDPQQLKCSVQL